MAKRTNHKGDNFQNEHPQKTRPRNDKEQNVNSVLYGYYLVYKGERKAKGPGGNGHHPFVCLIVFLSLALVKNINLAFAGLIQFPITGFVTHKVLLPLYTVLMELPFFRCFLASEWNVRPVIVLGGDSFLCGIIKNITKTIRMAINIPGCWNIIKSPKRLPIPSYLRGIMITPASVKVNQIFRRFQW
jgi:hypothetical protein